MEQFYEQKFNSSTTDATSFTYRISINRFHEQKSAASSKNKIVHEELKNISSESVISLNKFIYQSWLNFAEVRMLGLFWKTVHFSFIDFILL